MRACFGYYRSKGFTTNGLNLAAMSLVCDSLNLLRDALRGVVNPTTTDLNNAVAALGTRFRVASTFTSRFGPRQHDGIGSYRFLAYATDCSCFRYRGGDRSV
jgi:hypothetical protein